MTDQGLGKTKKIIQNLIFAVSLIPVILFLFVLAKRTALPFVLEWGEGPGVNQIERIISGNPLYSQPDEKFAALVYTPIYYYTSAGLAKIAGSALNGARLLSVVSAFGSAFLIGFLVWGEADNRFWGWVSGCFYLACFALADGFFDLARVDSFYVLIVLLGLIAALKTKTPLGYTGMGLVIAFGFFVKQSYLIIFTPFLAYLFIRESKGGRLALASAAAGILLPLVIINWTTDGWFSYYIFELPQEHGYSILAAVNFWIADTLTPLAVAILFSIAYLLLDSYSGEGEKNKRTSRKSIILAMGFILAAWLTRSTAGGGANNLMPLYAILAVGFGLGADRLLTAVGSGQSPYRILVVCAVMIQMIGLIYNPFNFIPTAEETAANRELQDAAAQEGWEALIPYRSHLLWGDQGPNQIHVVNLFELTGYFGGEVRQEGIEIVNRIREEICYQRYSVIVLDQPIPWYDGQIAQAYEQDLSFIAADFQHSPQLDWQRGRERTYHPRSDFDVGRCLETISR